MCCFAAGGIGVRARAVDNEPGRALASVDKVGRYGSLVMLGRFAMCETFRGRRDSAGMPFVSCSCNASPRKQVMLNLAGGVVLRQAAGTTFFSCNVSANAIISPCHWQVDTWWSLSFLVETGCESCPYSEPDLSLLPCPTRALRLAVPCGATTIRLEAPLELGCLGPPI